MINLLLNEIRAIDTEQLLRKPVIELTHLFSNHLIWTQDKLSIILTSIHFHVFGARRRSTQRALLTDALWL